MSHLTFHYIEETGYICSTEHPYFRN